MAVLLLAWTPSGAVTLGQVDDFEDGTVMGWTEGLFSPNPPTNQPSGGPAGLGDNYLLNLSSGGLGAGSRLVMFNQTQWAGNYLAAGVTRIDLQMANFGATTLQMRIAIENVLGTRYASTTAVACGRRGSKYTPVHRLVRTVLSYRVIQYESPPIISAITGKHPLRRFSSNPGWRSANSSTSRSMKSFASLSPLPVALR